MLRSPSLLDQALASPLLSTGLPTCEHTHSFYQLQTTPLGGPSPSECLSEKSQAAKKFTACSRQHPRTGLCPQSLRKGRSLTPVTARGPQGAATANPGWVFTSLTLLGPCAPPPYPRSLPLELPVTSAQIKVEFSSHWPLPCRNGWSVLTTLTSAQL